MALDPVPNFPERWREDCESDCRFANNAGDRGHCQDDAKARPAATEKRRGSRPRVVWGVIAIQLAAWSHLQKWPWVPIELSFRVTREFTRQGLPDRYKQEIETRFSNLRIFAEFPEFRRKRG